MSKPANEQPSSEPGVLDYRATPIPPTHYRVLFATLLVCAAAALFTLGVMFWAGDPGDREWWTETAPFLALAIAPYIVLGILGRGFRRRFDSAVVTLIGALAISGFGTWSIYDAMFQNLHSTSGVVFFFVPPIQLVGCAMTAAIAAALAMLHHWRRR